jgi:hypothetical protein
MLAVVATSGCAPAAGGLGHSAAPLSANSAPLDDQWVVAANPDIASATRPVVWFRDASDDHLLVAFDWSGKPAGSMRVRASEPFGVVQSPDGTALVLLHAQPVSGGAVVGRTKGNVSWARDSSHLCVFLTEGGGVYMPSLTPATPPAPSGQFTGGGAKGALFIQSVANGQSRRIETFGEYGDHGGPAILSCSVPDARAIVANTFVAMTFQVHGINLSSDRPAGAAGFAAQPPGVDGGIVASADGRLVGLGSTAETQTSDRSFVIRAVDTGTTLATVPGGIVAFSDDNSRVLTVGYVGSSTPGDTSPLGLYSLVDWRSGQVMWSGQEPISRAVGRPGTGDMLLEPWTYRPVPGANRSQSFTVPLIVHADGSTHHFPTELRPAEG